MAPHPTQNAWPLTLSLVLALTPTPSHSGCLHVCRDYDILLPLMASAGVGSLIVELVERKRNLDESK